MRSSPVRAHLVLVGGGHTHVQVLRRWITRPVDGVRLTVVLDRAEAVYSGMVLGFVAGDYATHELEIDVVALARRAGAGVVLTPATGIDPAAAVDSHELLDLRWIDIFSQLGVEVPMITLKVLEELKECLQRDPSLPFGTQAAFFLTRRGQIVRDTL